MGSAVGSAFASTAHEGGAKRQTGAESDHDRRAKDARVRLAALLTAPLLVLAACGDATSDDDENGADDPFDDFEFEEPEEVEPAEDDEILDAVTVSDNVGERPEVEIDGEIETDTTVRRVVVEGDGEPFSGEVFADVELAGFSGATGEELSDISTYDFAPAPMSAMEMLYAEGFGEAMLEVPLGSRVVAAIPQIDEIPFHEDLGDGDTFVAVIDVLEPRERDELPNPDDLPSQRAEGEEVTPSGDNLPEVTLADDGEPSIEVPDADPPEELVSELLIEGDGDEVPRGATIMAQYTGVLWDDGSEFDSSWERDEPSVFGLDQVIPGWTQGLSGYPVGSQVLLVIPPDLGYGEVGSGENVPPDATLVFVVDILATD
jgi:peptidylprolyl isomerase